jgi:hypothetical protein
MLMFLARTGEKSDRLHACMHMQFPNSMFAIK